MCASFCTLDAALDALKTVCDRYGEVTPILSERLYSTDSRFGTAQSFIARAEQLCARRVLKSVTETEPIGPKALFDVLIIAPCTGNTLSKLAHGVTDSSVTMAAKAHLRNGRPLVLAVATNDGLGASAENIGRLLVRRDVYFVPFRQDDPEGKPRSLTADLSRLTDTVDAALEGRQLQPLLV